MSVSGPQTGKPAIEGTYVAEVYHGWRVLEWCAGRWCYDGGWAHWQAGEPVQWIGPLPDRVGTAEPPRIEGQDLQWTPEQIVRTFDENAPPLQPNKMPPMEFDL